MNCKKYLSLCLFGPSALFLSTSCQKSLPKPNIVLLIADDVSWDDFGCYGNTQVKTPNIDRIAASGVIFSDFFLTASSSSPSRNSIITGRYPHNTGGAELHAEPGDEMVSFPEILRQNGYYTAQSGKFHMGPYARRGFDLINDRNCGDGGEERWIETLRGRAPDKPFFMWFASFDAHRIWGPNDFSGKHIPADITPPSYLVQGGKTKDDLAKYYDEIARFDHFVGLVENELERQNVLSNTVIIIMADNGRPFPHSKTRVTDRGMKSPFIIYWPDGAGKKQKVCRSLVSAVDLAPTILEIASAEAPESVQGHSFVRLLNNPEAEFRSFAFAEHNWHDYEAHERMVRTKDFLYILNSRPQFPQMGPADAIGSPSFAELDSLRKINTISVRQSDIFTSPRPSEELYKNDIDPEQFNNIAGFPEYIEELKELRKILQEWMAETGDNIPENLTKDWYGRVPGYVKTEHFNVRGEPVDEKFSATNNNSKGKF